jgi:putative drug exporter of the RND superfamily
LSRKRGWPWIAATVVRHPGRAALLALALLVPPLLALPAMSLTNDTLAELPAGAEAVRGYDALERHFAPGELSPVIVVIDGDEPVTSPAAFRALGDLSKNLKRLDSVATVRSAAMPTDGKAPDLTGIDGAADVAGQIGEFTTKLTEAADGAGRIRDGLAQATAGVAEIDRRLPELETGLTDATAGVDELLAGVGQLRSGLGQLDGGLGELRGGLVRARDGAGRLATEAAAPAEQAIRAAWSTLFDDFTLGRTDPAYRDALEQVGEVHGRLTGEDPRNGVRVDPEYAGLTASLTELRTGLGDGVTGVEDLRAGITQVDGGLAQFEDGLGRLRDGLTDAGPGISELRAGIAELLDGLGQLEAGAGELATGLALGVDQLAATDLASLLPTADEGSGPFVLTAAMLDAVDGVRERLDFFLTEDGTRTRVLVGLATSPFSPESMASVAEIEHLARLSLQGSPLADATVRLTGLTPFMTDLDAAADSDFGLIVVAVVLGVFLVLVALLRAIVAPLYMVASVLLSFGAALGLTTIVFEGFLGHGGLAWWVPPFLFVLLVALGADYTIYLMSRVREEAAVHPTKVAVERGTAATGGVITSAGLILAGTFLAMVAADMTSLQQMGFATTVGILLDTFVVRTLLVPAVATMLGRHNWWPSRRARTA